MVRSMNELNRATDPVNHAPPWMDPWTLGVKTKVRAPTTADRAHGAHGAPLAHLSPDLNPQIWRTTRHSVGGGVTGVRTFDCMAV